MGGTTGSEPKLERLVHQMRSFLHLVYSSPIRLLSVWRPLPPEMPHQQEYSRQEDQSLRSSLSLAEVHRCLYRDLLKSPRLISSFTDFIWLGCFSCGLDWRCRSDWQSRRWQFGLQNPSRELSKWLWRRWKACRQDPNELDMLVWTKTWWITVVQLILLLS